MIVELYNGGKAPRKKTRKIKGKYYLINKHCFKIDGIWRRIDDPKIAYDTDKDEWTKIDFAKGERFIRGINDKGEYLYSFGRKIPSKARACVIDGQFLLAHKDIVKDFNYCKETDVYYVDDKKIAESNSLLYNKMEYNFSKMYGYFEGRRYSTRGKFGLKSDLTIGVEMETCSGEVPIKDLVKVGLCPLRDGSIEGYEYTSYPTKYYNRLIRIAETVDKKCSVNHNCSFHIHFGGFDVTEENIVKLYHTFYSLQDDIYAMFPAYKRNDEHGVKRRSYTAELSNLFNSDISKYFKNILTFLADGEEVSYEGKPIAHPKDPNGEHKWYINSRYTFVNFVNMIFSNSGTIESRIHEGTTNKYKIVYWAMVNEAIIKFALKYDFKELTRIFNNGFGLNDVINDIYDNEKANALISYVNERKELFNGVSDPYCQFLSDEDKSWNPAIKLF